MPTSLQGSGMRWTGVLRKGPQAFLRFLCPGLVFSRAMAMVSVQRRLSTGISTL